MQEILKKHQKIRFSMVFASHQNGEAENYINTVLTMYISMIIYNMMRCTKEKFSTDICKMSMGYDLFIYNNNPTTQSGLYYNYIWLRSRFEPVSETLSNFHVWGFPEYVLEPKLQKP